MDGTNEKRPPGTIRRAAETAQTTKPHAHYSTVGRYAWRRARGLLTWRDAAIWHRMRYGRTGAEAASCAG